MSSPVQDRPEPVSGTERFRELSNPFCTRFTKPGALPYQFDADQDAVAMPNPSPIARLVHALQREQLAVIVGPHGTGKTTLLQAMMPRLQNSFATIAFERLAGPAENQQLSWFHRWRIRRQHQTLLAAQVRDAQTTLGSCDDARRLLVIDGAEQLAHTDLQRMVRSAKRNGHSVMVTSHQPLRSFAIIHQTRCDVEIVGELIVHLLRDAPVALQTHVTGHLKKRPLHETDNVRDLWFELYDVCNEWICRSK